MAKFHDSLTHDLRDFIALQKMFFTASAAVTGRVNLSPKGMDTLRVLSERELCYLDLTGSGNETAAHLRAANRMTFMWCSFDEKPLILRVYAAGRSILPRDARWNEFASMFPQHPGMRQIILSQVQSVQTSCGFGVPLYDFRAERPTLDEWTAKKGEAAIERYWLEKNAKSIDGLETGIVG